MGLTGAFIDNVQLPLITVDHPLIASDFFLHIFQGRTEPQERRHVGGDQGDQPHCVFNRHCPYR